MTRSSAWIPAELGEYIAANASPADDVERRLIEETTELGRASGMQVSLEQSRFLTMIASLVRPRLAIEIGTFTGLSAMSIARGLADGGRLLCCDVSEEWTSIARRHWAEAGVAERIDLVIAPASETLASLDPDLAVDLAFIDADKTGYLDYYHQLVPRLSPDGVILVDNTLWDGQVVDAADQSPDTVALRAFNDTVAADDRVMQVIVPIGDGVTMIRRS